MTKIFRNTIDKCITTSKSSIKENVTRSIKFEIRLLININKGFTTA